MSVFLASILLGAAAARVETIQLLDGGARSSVRVVWSGTPARVSVQREGGIARVTLTDADLGSIYSGGSRYAWTSATAPAPVSQLPIQGLDVESRAGEVRFSFHVAPETPIDVQRGHEHMLVSFRTGGPPAGTLVARTAPVVPTAATRQVPAAPPAPARATVPVPAPAPAPPAPPPAPPPVPSPAPAQAQVIAPPPPPPSGAPILEPSPPVAAPVAEPKPEPTREVPTSAPAATSTADSSTAQAPPVSDLHERLFPVPPDTSAYEPQETGAPATDLYSKLFPYSAEASSAPLAATETVTPNMEDMAPGLHLGPFNVRPGVRAGYVDAQANFLSGPVPVRDQYFEFQPKVAVDAGVGAGLFTLRYEPILRAFGSFDVTTAPTHPVEAKLDVPLGARGRFKLTDTFISGVLETTQVDPGGEYFFDLGRFNKNSVAADASIDVGPRLFVELGGGFDWVDFTEPSAFFGYRRVMSTFGLGYEATPTLKTTLSYVYDTVPEVEERPQATYDAHSIELGLLGDILPLLRGSLHVAYRDQTSPNAPLEGRRFRGMTAAATLTRDLGRESAVTLLFNRSTPLSNYEDNAFYVSTALSASVLAPLPYGIGLNAGGGYHWNDYQTLVTGEDFKREDRIFGWFVGLRRPIDRRMSAFAGYRWERRKSNVDPFENDTDGFLLQLDVDIFGRTR